MSIGERIRYICNFKGMTQKWLDMAIGFDERTADVRIAQYESGTRTPKEKLVAAVTNALEVRPQALDLPDIDSYVGLCRALCLLWRIFAAFALVRLENFASDWTRAREPPTSPCSIFSARGNGKPKSYGAEKSPKRSTMLGGITT